MNSGRGEHRRLHRGFRGNPSHLRRLIEAVEAQKPELWNDWRKDHPALRPDLRAADLTDVNFRDIDLSSARLSRAKLGGARWQARLKDADLRHANLDGIELNYADLRGANLGSARLVTANLTLVRADGASFRDADLSHAILNGADLQGADLTGARVAGTSAWGVAIDARTRQDNLIIDEWIDPLLDFGDDARAGIESIIVRVDHIEAAHLLYLVSTKGKFKTIIDAMTARVVLLLGNFGSRRKAVLNLVRHKLADLGYAPVVFDFAKPVDRDLIETVALIAGLSRFVIADLTRPKSTPLESLLIAPQLMVPFASIIHRRERPFSMFRSLQAKYEWVLPTWSYDTQRDLIRRLKPAVVDPCERMRVRLSRRREAAGVPKGKPLDRRQAAKRSLTPPRGRSSGRSRRAGSAGKR